ncbi:MAG: hypothetical protein HY811_01260 [Planctomycetes bacterium]|nr:hypothetical protein [Planctomycetota bacterium]
MKKILWLLLAALCLAFNTASAQEESDIIGSGDPDSKGNKTWTSGEWGFEITLPAEWKTIKYPAGKSALALDFENEDKSVTGYIAVEKYDGRCDDYINSIISPLIEQYKIKILEKPEGEKDSTIVYTSVVGEDKSKHYWRVIDEQGEKIRVGFTCKRSEYDDYAETFETCAATLKSVQKKETDEPSSAGDKTWSSDKWGFELTIPEDWNMEIRESALGTLVATFSGAKGKIEGLITIAEWKDGCDAYLNNIIETLKDPNNNYEIEVIKKPLGKTDATIIYTISDSESKRQYYQRAIDIGGFILRVDFDSEKASFSKYRDTFERCAATLKSIPEKQINTPIETEDKTWSSEKWGFRLTLPADWNMEIYDRAKDEVTVAFASDSKEIRGCAINVERGEATCVEYLNASLDNLKKKLEVKILKKPSGNDDEATAIYTAVVQDTTFQYYARVIRADDTILTVCFLTEKKYYAETSDMFEKYAATLKPLSDTPKQKPKDKTWSSKKWGFELSLPGDWKIVILDNIDGTIVTRFENETNGIYGIVTTSDFEGGADDYLKDIMEGLKESEDTEIVVKPKGKQSATLVYICDVSGTDYEYYAHAIDVDGNKKLRVVFYCVEKIYDKYSELFEKYSSTLKPLADTPKQKPKDKTWSSEKWGFEINLPAEWKMDILDKADGSLIAEFSNDAAGIYGLITKSEFEGGADDYLKGVLDGLKNDGEVEVVVKPKGKRRATLVYICDINGTDYEYYAHAIDADGTKFRIVFYCPKTIYDNYSDTFEKYADTFNTLDE